MFYKLIFVSISTCLLCNNVFCEENPIVETKHGQIAGKVSKTLFKNVDYYGFKGIPFAEPPLGELKFMVGTFCSFYSFVSYYKSPICVC